MFSLNWAKFHFLTTVVSSRIIDEIKKELIQKGNESYNFIFSIKISRSQVSDFTFDAQRKTFHTEGYAEDPTAYSSTPATKYVGLIEKAEQKVTLILFESK